MIFIQGGRLFNPRRGKHMLKFAESHRADFLTHHGNLLVILTRFVRFLSKGIFLENRSQNLKGVTDLSQENF